jgi:hypothetical protein
MILRSPGVLLVGTIKGTLEMFTFSKHKVKISPILPSFENSIDVAGAGEIYNIVIASKGNEIALASFSGLFFGRINVIGDGIKQEWETNKLYFRDKLISQVCQITDGKYLVAEYSQPGYYIIDRHDNFA